MSPILADAVYAGLLTGFAEAGLLLLLQSRNGWVTWALMQFRVSADALWMAPLINAAVFGLVGAGLAVLVALWGFVPLLSRHRPHVLPAFVFSSMAWYVVFSVFGRLHPAAVVAISMGLAARFPRAWCPREARTPRWHPKSLPGLAGAWALSAIVIVGGGRTLEARRVASLPPPPAGVPNVVLVVLDTVRADHLSVYGYGRRTSPTLERLASEGVLFERAFSASAWTLPAHASLFTGLPVTAHQADSARPWLDTRFVTLAEVLADSGYVTAGFSGNTGWATRATGLAQGFVRFEDCCRTVPDAVSRTVLGRYLVLPFYRHFGPRVDVDWPSGTDITRAFSRWLARQPDRPFFVFINYMDAHGPYVSPAPFQTMFMTPAQRQVERHASLRAPDTVDRVLEGEQPLYAAAYDAGIAYVDDHVRALTALLRAGGELDNTVLVVVSDHGEALGEHGLYNHSNSLYQHQTRVPLLIRYPPAAPAGVRLDTAVSSADVGRTILDLVGLGETRFPGQSLASTWAPVAGASAPRGVFSHLDRRENVPARWANSSGWVRSVVEGDWHFILREGGDAELFDLVSDPGEVVNLAGSPEGERVRAALKARLDRAAAAGLDGPQ